ncbi:flagellar hook-length control protein FliK [Paenibacillus glycinis]|uniref:Flagellar hook-length control protein-like C-terminal domain-containing protein n=1 Tax=Paenibacillus glycinis TaxID=2697035 RepID=A0ABW9XIV4_9BACL|nr:flagellar hook-length control protein FliK [Paenibacillus glycinis]NBD22466.1 hypothetical protein [Paenibacillus glycinis]
MQMPISNASPAPAPGPGAASAASAKGTDGGNFNQTLVQTVAGSQGKEASAQAGSETAVPAGAASASATLASLLGGKLDAKDLLAAIEALLQRLDDADAGDLSEATTESNLADALQQLDDLLSVLAGVPLLQQPIATTQAGATSDGDASADNGTDAGSALLAVLSNMNAAVSQAASMQAAETAVPNQAQAVVANLEELNALKAGLQEALTDLRGMLQDPKGPSANKDQLALIGKELASVERLMQGKPAAASDPIAAANNANAAEVVDSVRSLQTPIQGNAHLQRMSHQLLHVGLLNVVQQPEKQGTEAEASTKLAADANEINPQLAGANLDLQRQLASVAKPLIAQPVPVQQFASTIQGLVVKQFNVSTGNGISQAQLTLFPEHLGQVNVNISVHNGTLTAQFVTDTVTAKDMLENQMAQLRSALQSQGLQVDKLVVSQTAVQPNMFQDRQGQQGQNQGTSKRNKSQDDAIDEIDFTADLEELSTQQAVDRDLGLGRGIHTIA